MRLTKNPTSTNTILMKVPQRQFFPSKPKRVLNSSLLQGLIKHKELETSFEISIDEESHVMRINKLTDLDYLLLAATQPPMT